MRSSRSPETPTSYRREEHQRNRHQRGAERCGNDRRSARSRPLGRSQHIGVHHARVDRQWRDVNGAHNLSITADGDQTARVTALAGALAGEDASAQTVAAQVTGNASLVLIDVGTAMALSGTLTARSNHKATNIIRASSDAAAAQADSATSSLALPMAVNLANDVATTTISGTVSAVGAITITSDADVQNQAEGVAGVQGADPDNTTAASLVSDELAFLSNRANLSFGSSPKPPATDPGRRHEQLVRARGQSDARQSRRARRQSVQCIVECSHHEHRHGHGARAGRSALSRRAMWIPMHWRAPARC